MANIDLRKNGLTTTDAKARFAKHGPNALPEKPPLPIWRRFVNQFRSPLIYILLFALVVDIVVWVVDGADSLPVESLAIAIILLLNAGLGVYQENKSEAALGKLRELATQAVWAVRDGNLVRLAVDVLVPGDVIRIEAGERVPADGRLLEADGVLVDESVLTGESLPVDKSRGDEVSSGTLLVRGKCYAQVDRTGPASAMGKLAAMLGGVGPEKTPLEKRIERFAGQLAKAILVLVVFIAIGGVAVEGIANISHVFLFAVALAVAAVPEGLPAVLTMTLALGVERMAKRKAVVRRLSAVEALGSITLIATDKTGTLTENKMFVKALDSPDVERALRAMVLVNDAEVRAEAGDPLELALFQYVRERGVDPIETQQEFPRSESRPFDSVNKSMRVTVMENNAKVSYLKGAPEVLLGQSKCAPDERKYWQDKADNYARQGNRVLALGWSEGAAETDLAILGLVVLWDPPRREVPNAIRRAIAAGIRVAMVTGDHPSTGSAMASEVGIESASVVTGSELDGLDQDQLNDLVRACNVFARVSPEHKLQLVGAFKQQGDIVAMTGDGVNDAPALKRADVGVAMGQRGSDVSREVADIVLLDDNFATIVAAIEEGRNIYENIQKFIRFLFSTNLAELLIVVGGAIGAVLLGLRDAAGAVILPLTAVQLLWVNIITDGPPALALALDRNPDVMRTKPRDPHAPLLDWPSFQFILGTGLLKALVAGALLVSMPMLGFTLYQTQTAIFLHTTIGQLFYVYPSRRINSNPSFNGALHLAVIFGIALQFATVLVPGLRAMLGLQPITFNMFLLVAVAVLITWGLAELYSMLSMRRTRVAMQ